MSDPKRIAELRKPERDAMKPEERQLKALEDIADTLEALRIDLRSWAKQPARR